MTDKQIRDAINTQGVAGWNFVKAANKHTLTVAFSNSWSGVSVTGATGTLNTQLLAIAAEIRVILMDECEDEFPTNQGVALTVDGTVPSPASPYPPQYPSPPPVIIQPLPDMTPVTTNDKIYYV